MIGAFASPLFLSFHIFPPIHIFSLFLHSFIRLVLLNLHVFFAGRDVVGNEWMDGRG